MRFWKAREAKRKQNPQVYYVGVFSMMIMMMVVVVVVMVVVVVVCLPLSLVISADSFHSARTGVLFPIWIRMTKHGVVMSLFFTLVQCSQPVKLLTSQRPQCHRVARSRDMGYTEARVTLRDSSLLRAGAFMWQLFSFTDCMSVIEVFVIPRTWFLARFT